MADDGTAGEPLGTARRRNHLIWLGPIVTLVGALSYFMFFARFPALRDIPWLNLPLVWIGLLLSALGVWRAFRKGSPYRGRILGSIGALFSLALALLFNLYIFSLSYQMPEPTEATLSIGTAPDFTLTDQHQNPVSLSAFRGRKVVLTFYRGFW